ncbi:riboflavin synthase, alpha subunit [delta proteobacterium NaphS2]|nr:riboflavin synthase, alpha subunit [delta proteobacterium NaphS2]
MFTGLAEGIGTIKGMRRMQDHMEICVVPLFEMAGCKLGDSVSVSGVCLTVSRMEADAFYMDVSGETLSRSTLGLMKQGDHVNLERALRLMDRLGGHLVLGHVDGLGKITKKEERNKSWLLRIKIPANLSRYIIEKGSIAVDGISLTINACENEFFDVNIIPHTGTETALLRKNVGEPVNIETDLIGKYVEKLLLTKPSESKERKSSGVTVETLLKYGFGK